MCRRKSGRRQKYTYTYDMAVIFFTYAKEDTIYKEEENSRERSQRTKNSKIRHLIWNRWIVNDTFSKLLLKTLK